jgi:hypothetical protein
MNRRRGFRQRGYDSRWDKLSTAFLQACPYCVGCWAVNIRERATVADHVRPFAQYREGLLEADGLQALCAWHHNSIKKVIEVQVAFGELPEGALKLDSLWARQLTRERYRIPVAVSGFKEWSWPELRPLGPYPYRYEDCSDDGG